MFTPVLSFTVQIVQIIQKMNGFFVWSSNVWTVKFDGFQIFLKFCTENFYKIQVMKRKILWFSSIWIKILNEIQGRIMSKMSCYILYMLPILIVFFYESLDTYENVFTHSLQEYGFLDDCSGVLK